MNKKQSQKEEYDSEPHESEEEIVEDIKEISDLLMDSIEENLGKEIQESIDELQEEEYDYNHKSEGYHPEKDYDSEDEPDYVEQKETKYIDDNSDLFKYRSKSERDNIKKEKQYMEYLIESLGGDPGEG